MAIEQIPIRRSALSIDEAAWSLGLSERTVRRAIKSGQLEHRRIGDRVLIPIRALEQWSGCDIRVGETEREPVAG